MFGFEIIRGQIAYMIVSVFRGEYNDGSYRIVTIRDAVYYALASLPCLDCMVQDDGTTVVFLHAPWFIG